MMMLQRSGTVVGCRICLALMSVKSGRSPWAYSLWMWWTQYKHRVCMRLKRSTSRASGDWLDLRVHVCQQPAGQVQHAMNVAPGGKRECSNILRVGPVQGHCYVTPCAGWPTDRRFKTLRPRCDGPEFKAGHDCASD